MHFVYSMVPDLLNIGGAEYFISNDVSAVRAGIDIAKVTSDQHWEKTSKRLPNRAHFTVA